MNEPKNCPLCNGEMSREVFDEYDIVEHAQMRPRCPLRGCSFTEQQWDILTRASTVEEREARELLSNYYGEHLQKPRCVVKQDDLCHCAYCVQYRNLPQCPNCHGTKIDPTREAYDNTMDNACELCPTRASTVEERKTVWVSVEERLPAEDMDVLIWNGGWSIAIFYWGKWFDAYSEESDELEGVTHWADIHPPVPITAPRSEQGARSTDKDVFRKESRP